MCAVRVTLCVSGIVRAVNQSSSKLGDTPLARLDLFESLPSQRFGCRASTTNSTAKSRSTSLYIGLTSSRGGCRALQLYSAPHLYSSTALYTLHPLHPPSGGDPAGERQRAPRTVGCPRPRARVTWASERAAHGLTQAGKLLAICAPAAKKPKSPAMEIGRNRLAI